ncbi:MAG: GNAT family N-acetyltransferase [Vitreoscilla sp.]
MSIRNLDALMHPRSVAIVGASDRPSSVGATVWHNLRAGTFTGELMPVNPKHRELDGVAVARRCGELERAPDLALVCTPAQTLVEIIGELAAIGTRAVVVLTAGVDAALKQTLRELARPTTMRLLGPNCLGLLSPGLGLNASFAHTDALPGDVAFVSQSGALVTAVLDWAKSRQVGFSHMVSLGEHMDVDFGDLLDYLASDASTRSILLYIESIESPRKFMSAARAAARNKPVIVVKAGRSARGAQAAASHTGALAGSDIVFDAAIRRAGMLRVDTLQDLFVAAETLARFDADVDSGLTLLTNGGGAGVLAADAAAAAGVVMRSLSPSLRERLDSTLTSGWSHGNPIDIVGDAPAERYVQTLEALLADADTGAILFMHAPTAIVPSVDIARACLPAARTARRRLLSCWLGDGAVAGARHLFEKAGVADFDTPEAAIQACAMLSTYRRNQAMLLEAPSASAASTPDKTAARALLTAALAAGRDALDEVQSKQLLQAYGIPTVRTTRVRATAGDAAIAARQIGYPVALKILSPDLSHKSDAGGVMLDIADEPALRAAADRMLACVTALRPDARIEGFSVQAMAHRPHAQELIVGASVDAVFGPVLMFGQGGTAVEVIADRAIALPPLNRVLARDLVSRTRVAKLLQGYRGRDPADIGAVCDVLVALSQMQADLPELAELDINPLWADEDGVLALDARVRLSRTPVAGADRFAIRPFPAELTERVDWQGRTVTLRAIRPEDEPLHRAFIAHVSPADLRLRFFSSRRELPRTELARLVQIDYAREMAFIALDTAPDGPQETLGVVRAVCDPDDIEAEFALLVRTDVQGHRLGTVLMTKMVGYLASRGVQRMCGYVLRENAPMHALLLGLGFEPESHTREPGTVYYSLALHPAAEAAVPA